MPDDPFTPDAGDHGDLLDEDLAGRFLELETLTPPDIWSRTTAGMEGPSVGRSRFGIERRAALLVAAIAVAVAGVAALQMGSSDTSEVDVANPPDISDGTDDTPEGSTVEPGPEVTTQPEPTPVPTVTVDGIAIADLRLEDGGRLRLTLPEQLATDLRLIESETTEPVRLEGADTSIEIHFETCGDVSPLGIDRGSTVTRTSDGDGVSVCRSEAVLHAIVRSANPVDEVDLDTFDIRPIAVSGDYAQALVGVWPRLKNCGNCAPWGPITFVDDGVVVTRAGANTVEAVATDTLEAVWTVEADGSGAALHGGPDGVYVEVFGDSLRRLDPATGTEEWRVDLDPAERSLALDVVEGDVAVVRSYGDTAAPLLRRIDMATGDVVWTASGRDGARWQTDPAIGVGGLVVLADDPAAGGGPTATSLVWAFDAADGSTVWTAELESSEGVFGGGSTTTLAFEFGTALLARSAGGDVQRIDPETGEVMWRTEGLRAEVTGTNFAREGFLAIDLATPTGQRLLDPATGLEVTAIGTELPPSCPVTVPSEAGFVPPDPWPATPSAAGLVWYGSSELWTAIDRSGHTPRKAVFWSANFPGGAVEERPELEVAYRQLGPDETVIVFDAPGTNAYTPEDGDFMINGIEPDTPGCWLVTARYKDATLSYVYEIS